MPALTAPQLALLRSSPQTSNWYCIPIPPVTVFAAQINGSPGVGAVTIPYDTVTFGAFGDVKQGMTLWVGTTPDSSDIAIIRIRLVATASNLYVAWNSDIAWADNLYLTVKKQYLPWSVRQRIVPPTIYKDYNIAYSDQTNLWPPVAMMGDNVCKLWAGNPTTVYFDGSESYAVAAGATITGYAWDFDDGTNSAVATPGNHNYTAAGTYYPTLTVTDSNGKTHLTRRIVSLPDPATVFTVNFEQTELSAQIDDGWKAKVRVFDPNANLANFPERAPCFLISADTYAGTSGSVGFPLDRENVVLFGYIVEDSVAVQPEYNEITFNIESIAGVMGKADSTPVFMSDSSNPAGNPDAWAWGKNLNVFRGLVFLLKFHSTIMDIADVQLYNDTTVTKMVDYPQDNLWNMLVQFAKGKRLMHAGVTRTGRIVVGRDPNLTPVASRGAFTTVCQLLDGDWQEQVTIPQKPYPTTSFCCISGLVYDGNPAHEPNPVFGMSPGRPPKDYGSEKELQFLKFVSQTECNTIAGLIVGTDNMPYGDIVIPMRGNWTRAFDPARQEYVQAPSSGFVTKRGILIANALLIVRKVAIKFDWAAGMMQPTLTCEYYSQPEIGVNGDCFPPDAPPYPFALPGGNIIIPPIAPKPTGSGTFYFSRGIWTLFSGSTIYKLTSASPAGGTAVAKPNWLSGPGATYYADSLAPANSTILVVMADDGAQVWMGRSTDDGVTWSVTSTGIAGYGNTIMSDHSNRNRLWAVNFPINSVNALHDLLAAQVSGAGIFSYAAALNGYTNWVGALAPLQIWMSADGGGTWNSILLDYAANVFPTQLQGDPSGSAVRCFYYGSDAFSTVPGHPITYYEAHLCTDLTVAWGAAQVPPIGGEWFYDGSTPPEVGTLADTVLKKVVEYDVCTSAQLRVRTALKFWDKSVNHIFLSPAQDNLHVCVGMSGSYYSNEVSNGTLQYVVCPFQPYSTTIGAHTTPALIYKNYLYRIATDGTVERFAMLASDYSGTAGDIIKAGCVDPVAVSKLYCITEYNLLITVTWGSPTTYTSASLGVGADQAKDIFITTQGTIIVGVQAATPYLRRSTNHGSIWTTISPAGLTGTSLDTFVCTEYGGVVGGAVGVLVFCIPYSGKYLYSFDDGVTWNVTSAIVTNDWVNANSAR